MPQVFYFLDQPGHARFIICVEISLLAGIDVQHGHHNAIHDHWNHQLAARQTAARHVSRKSFDIRDIHRRL